MAPIFIITVPCDKTPCNISATYVDLANLTSLGDSTTTEPEVDYDHEGAARFIIATVLVYSLLGVFGTLLLRIKRSASRSRRIVNVREESVNKYIKDSKRLSMRGRREVLKKETERFIDRMNFLSQHPAEHPRGASQHYLHQLGSTTSARPSLADLRSTGHSPSISLLMPLLPTLPETPDSAMGSPTPTLVYHFPYLNPITLSETSLTSSPTKLLPNKEPHEVPQVTNCHPVLPSATTHQHSDDSSSHSAVSCSPTCNVGDD